MKKAIVEHSSKIGKADWQCFRLSAFSAGVQRAVSPLCRVQGRSTLLGSRGKAHWQVKGGSHYRVKDEVPWRVEGGSPIGSRVKRLAQGEVLLCDNSYWVVPVAKIAGLAASPLLPLSGKSAKIGGKRIETDTSQWQSRKKWDL